jgi:hypothetical protein
MINRYIFPFIVESALSSKDFASFSVHHDNRYGYPNTYLENLGASLYMVATKHHVMRNTMAAVMGILIEIGIARLLAMA